MTKRILLILFCIAFTILSFPITGYAADVNLALGKSYTVSSEAAIENGFPNLVPEDSGQLTDGLTAESSASDLNWMILYRGIFHDIVIDLGDEKAVSGYSVGQLSLAGAGIQLSRYVEFSVSLDGNEYFLINRLEKDGFNLSSGNGRKVLKYDGDECYRARYVKIRFSTDVFCYVDEIEIYGSDCDGSEQTAQNKQEIAYTNAFVPNNVEALGGTSNSVLIYNSEYYNGGVSDVGKNTYDELLPYIAYVDSQKNIKDTMFDSALFLPLNPGTDGEYSLSRQTGWLRYLENTIGSEEDINLTALDRLVGDVKSALALDSEYRFPVIMTVPFNGPSSSVFGTVDDKTIALSSLDSINAAVEWFVDESIKAFSTAKFENLTLVGFYWYSELIHYSSADFAEEMVINFNDYVHSKDLGTIWIPYYCAPGMERAQALGFDVACVQNGYAFPNDKTSQTGEQKPGVIDDSLDIAYKYGMGAEIEIQLVSDFYERYCEYISANYTAGIMANSYTAFYQGGGPGAFYTCAYGGYQQREIYDITYKYIKGSYMEYAPVIKQEGALYFQKNSTKNSATLDISDEDTLKTALSISYLEEPKHGRLSIDADGYFIYVPDEGYVGDDSFVIEVTDGRHSSGKVTIPIKVVETLMILNKPTSDLTGSKMIRFAVGQSTNTVGDSIYEVAISAEGKVISAAYAANTSIPEGGYVIAAVGNDKIEWLVQNAVIGRTAIYDPVTNSLVFINDSDTQTSDTESAFSVSATVIICLAAVLAVAAVAFTIYYLKKRQKRSQKS